MYEQNRASGQYRDRQPRRDKPPAFTALVTLNLDFDLAFTLANFILDNKCTNPALVAMARQITGGD